MRKNDQSRWRALTALLADVRHRAGKLRNQCTALSLAVVPLCFWWGSARLLAQDAGEELAPPRVAPPSAELVEAFELDPFYRKAIVRNGFPILSSAAVSDAALREAAWLVDHLLAGRDDLRQALVRNHVRLVVMSPRELTLDVPEHSDLTPPVYWNRRARGLGASPERPAVSCGEENLLNCPGDPYDGESIPIHEFAHAIHLMALNDVDPGFQERLDATYRQALEEGLWKETYAATNASEYWAEGVQSWFHCNRTNVREHNHINSRAALRDYDPRLARLLGEVFRDNDWTWTDSRQRAGQGHLTGLDRDQLPRFAWDEELQQAYDAYQAEQKKRQKNAEPGTD